MKRIYKLFILVVLTITTSFILSGCSLLDRSSESNELQLEYSFELVAAKIESQTQISEDISGTYLFCLGSMSVNIETTTTSVYKYWYKRKDGGIIPATIDMSSYNHPENVTIVIYEDDSAKPKVEIWRNNFAQKIGDGKRKDAITEIRFTIPSGSFVNTYDLQGFTGESQ